jgi:hypothetical protein
MKRWHFSSDIPTDSIGIYGEKSGAEKNCRRAFPILSARNCKKFSRIPGQAMSGKPLRHNMAKVEILGCLEKIEAMLAQGFSKRIVYEKLLEEKRLSMAYVTFCKLTLRAERSSLLPQPKAAPAPVQTEIQPPAPKPLPSSGPRIVNTAKEPFPDPRKMSLEDGI